MHEHGVPITFGSDAHKPSQVGRDFDQLLTLARSAGYTDYVRLRRTRADPAAAAGDPVDMNARYARWPIDLHAYI